MLPRAKRCAKHFFQACEKCNCKGKVLFFWPLEEQEEENYENNVVGTDIDDVVITDDYDETELTIISLSDPVNCSDSGSIITCNLGTLIGGATGSISYEAQVSFTAVHETLISNMAEITAPSVPPGRDDRAYATVIVTDPPAADPMIWEKTVDNEFPSPGEQITYSVEYRNLGDADATNVVIVDDCDGPHNMVGFDPLFQGQLLPYEVTNGLTSVVETMYRNEMIKGFE